MTRADAEERDASELRKAPRFPRHIALSIQHNEHAGNYQTVAEYIGLGSERYAAHDPRFDDDEWVSPEEKARAIETGELWECHWNPSTPVGSCCLAASSLAALLAALTRIADEETEGRHCPADSKVAGAGYSLTVWDGADREAFPAEVPGEARRALALALCPEMFAAPLAHGRAPGVPMPVVEVQSCHACPAFAAHSYATTGRCRLAGVEVDAGSLAPAGCPLRSGPVALRLIDRSRP